MISIDKTFQVYSFSNVWQLFLHHNVEWNVVYRNIYVPEMIALNSGVWGSVTV